MNRRDFMKVMAGGAITMMAGEGLAGEMPIPAPPRERGRTRVALVKTADRAAGIKRSIKLLGVNPIRGKRVLLKPNFNTADPFPAATHNDTLIHLVAELKEMGAQTITIGERSGP
ncbi:MAG: hypothetical protein WA003_10105, partial [Desulfuromonadaceae bacterium]